MAPLSLGQLPGDIDARHASERPGAREILLQVQPHGSEIIRWQGTTHAERASPETQQSDPLGTAVLNAAFEVRADCSNDLTMVVHYAAA